MSACAVRLVRGWVVAVALCAAAALLVAGCGGGGGGDGDAEGRDASAGSVARTSSADVWRSRMNAICSDAADRVSSLPPVGAPEDVEPYLRAALAINDGLARDLAAVTPPPDLAARADHLVTGLAAVNRELRTYLTAVERGADPVRTGRRASAESVRLLAPVNAEAEALGLDVCADDTPPSERTRV